MRDYLAQVKRAAPIKEVPEFDDPTSRQLPFAPPGLRLEVVESGLIVESREVGFRLSNPLGPRRLDWIVESELLEVSARGRSLHSLGVRRRGIGTFRTDVGISFLHRIFSPAPAYYRADIRFYRKGTDRPLGQYSFYVRMMKPRVDLRVRIDTPTVSPGQFAKATLLNLGTVPLVTRTHDYGFGVQTFTGEKWIRVRDNPSRTLKRLGHWVLPAGVEDPCRLRYLAPSNQSPGLFRFIAYRVATGTDTLAAYFEVVSSP